MKRITHFRIAQDCEEIPFPKGSVVEVLSGLSGQGSVVLQGLHWTGAPTTYEITRAQYRSLRHFVLVNQHTEPTAAGVN